MAVEPRNLEPMEMKRPWTKTPVHLMSKWQVRKMFQHRRRCQYEQCNWDAYSESFCCHQQVKSLVAHAEVFAAGNMECVNMAEKQDDLWGELRYVEVMFESQYAHLIAEVEQWRVLARRESLTELNTEAAEPMQMQVAMDLLGQGLDEWVVGWSAHWDELVQARPRLRHSHDVERFLITSNADNNVGEGQYVWGGLVLPRSTLPNSFEFDDLVVVSCSCMAEESQDWRGMVGQWPAEQARRAMQRRA